MPILIAVLTVAAFVIWRLWARDRAQSEISSRLDPIYYRLFRRKKCKWALMDGRRSLNEFHCENCGVTAYSRSDNGPVECKRALRTSL